MDSIYPIMMGTATVGEARITKQGLYYLITCKCYLTGEVPYRVGIRCGACTEKLGILVPEHDYYTAQTRVPVSKLGKSGFSFCILPRHTPCKEAMTLLKPEEPFAYLHRLEEAYLRKKEKAAYISFTDSEDQSFATG